MEKLIKVLCVKQPWAWAIIEGGKDVENRVWKTNYRGRLYIAARKTIDNGSFGYISELIGDIPRPKSLVTGAIIGHVTLLDCIRDSISDWAQPNQWNWVLSSPKSITPIPIKGQLGIFNYTINV